MKRRRNKSFTNKIFSYLNDRLFFFLKLESEDRLSYYLHFVQSIFSKQVSHFFIPFAFELYFLMKGLENQRFSPSFFGPLIFFSCLHSLTTPIGTRSLEFKGFSHSNLQIISSLGVETRSSKRKIIKWELLQAREKHLVYYTKLPKEIGRQRKLRRKITNWMFLGKKTYFETGE